MSREKDIRDIKAYYPPEDVRFLENESQTFDAPRKLIDHLNSEQLGRLFVYSEEDEDGEIVATRNLAYSLPLSKTEKSHFIIFASGDMLGVRCSDLSSKKDSELYRSNFSADSRPLNFYEDLKTPVEAFAALKSTPEEFGAKITHASDNPSQLKALSALFDKAMSRVQIQREQRAEGRIMADSLIKAVTVFEKGGEGKPNPHKK